MNDLLRELPDYALVRRTVSGENFQVYEARAPGGIPKGVKVVPLDRRGPLSEQQRAGFELLLAARHPYIVGLDRIDVGPDRVVAVYEWPDATLRDEFRTARAAGLPGLPRRTLLGWLAEAAEGLDYLHSQWRVRHGAVRPENLYVFSGHVKLGEFGPLRELERNARPEVDPYAGPEPESSTPAARDQYALAATYCDLLCGALPFRARASTELRRLQLETDPDLRGVPVSDWAVLERALAPDPQRRFPTCRDFLAALMNASASAEPPAHDSGAETAGSTILDAGWHRPAAAGESANSALEDPEFLQALENFRIEQADESEANRWSSHRTAEVFANMLALAARRHGWQVEPGAEIGEFLVRPGVAAAWTLSGNAMPRGDGCLVTWVCTGDHSGRTETRGLARELGLHPAEDVAHRGAARRPWRGRLFVTADDGPAKRMKFAGVGIDISDRGVGFWTPMPFTAREVRVQRDGESMPRRARVVRMAPAPDGRPGHIVGLELLDGEFA